MYITMLYKSYFLWKYSFGPKLRRTSCRFGVSNEWGSKRPEKAAESVGPDW